MSEDNLEKRTESQESNDFVFLREEIKARPLNKQKIMRNSLVAAFSAVVFGLVACLTFVLLAPIFIEKFGRDKKDTPKIVTFPEETIDEEMNPEDMLVDSDENELDLSQFSFMEEDDVREIIAGIHFTVSDYQSLYESLGKIADEAERAVVKVSAINEGMDWFNNLYEGTHVVPGLIVADNGTSLLILTYQKPVKKASSLIVTFTNGIQAEATFIKDDDESGLCVIAVENDNLNEVTKSSIKVASLGSSFSLSLAGGPVIAVGSPSGMYGSINYGIITAMDEKIPVVDSYFKRLQTDICAGSSSLGFLVTTKGYFVGVISPEHRADGMENLICALGITELRNTIEKLSNGLDIPYFGIVGTDVPDEASFAYGAPKGAYVQSVEMDSPAMRAGIQAGDIVTSIGNSHISSFSEFATAVRNEKKGTELTVKVYRSVQNTYKELSLRIVLETR